MPLYEYQCGACAHRFEQIQRFSDPPATSCPRCGGAVRKLISSPAIQFKGTGWYVTDYARQGKKDPAEAESKGADGAASKSEKQDAGKKKNAGKSGGSASSSDSSSSSKPAKPASAGTSS